MSDGHEPSDEEIVRRVRAGDEAAARVLFDRHLPTLRAQAKRRLPAALRAKVGESDVVQDAYLAAFLSLGEFEDRGDGSFGRWVRQILEHKILGEVERHLEAGKRDARREVRFKTGVEAPVRAADHTSASGQFAAAEESARLREAMDHLPADYRAVIRLIHQEGLTVAEAAARMERTTNSIRKLRGRALARLAERLDRGGGAAS